MKIGIVGSSGAIGQSIAAALDRAVAPQDAPHPGDAQAIGQSIAAALDRVQRPYETIARSKASRLWNPESDDSVMAAFEGLDTLVYCVGVDYSQFHLHPQLMRTTLKAARAVGVQRILLIGTVYSYGLPETIPITESHPRRPHTYKGRMRLEQEQLLLDSGLQTAVLRLPDFFGADTDKSFLASALQAAQKGGSAQLFAPIDLPHQFVYIPDVGPVVVKMLDHPGIWGNWWHFAGSGTITSQNFTKEICRQAGREAKILSVPRWLLRLLGLFNPFLKELVEMHYLHTHPVVMDDSALRNLLGELPATPYPEAIAEILKSGPGR